VSRRHIRLRWRHAAPPEVKLLPLRQPVPACPALCDTDHSAELVDDLLVHRRTIAEINGGRVDVVVVDDLLSGERTEPAIEVDLNDAIGPEDARAMALALLDAADLAFPGRSA
jgi:hypothetical protein